MTDAPKFNLRNPAVKRIMQEMKEMKQDTSGDFIAEALETDIFEWHFVIRGPRDTEFDGGIFHGRVLLPAEYPFKPPSFMMLSPNGRFETGVKICLSISSHHPEHWQPSWSVRTALTALIAFMPSPGAGALGALDFPKEQRRQLAARSRVEAPRFGSAERQRVIDEMHDRILALAAVKDAERAVAATAAATQGSSGADQTRAAAADRPAEVAPAAEAAAASQPAQAASQSEGSEGRGVVHEAKASGAAETGASVPRADSQTALAVTNAAAARPPPSPARPPAPAAPAPPSLAAAPAASSTAPTTVAGRRDVAPTAWAPVAAPAPAGVPNSTDHMLTALMWALYVGIGAILLRKVMGAMGVDLTELMNDMMQ